MCPVEWIQEAGSLLGLQGPVAVLPYRATTALEGPSAWLEGGREVQKLDTGHQCVGDMYVHREKGRLSLRALPL